MTKYRTNFPLHYNQNLIPCHVYHKTSSFRLIWDKPFKDIDYSKVLTACFEGIIETSHPCMSNLFKRLNLLNIDKIFVI